MVGSGVVGLACAKLLLDSGFSVTVVADVWPTGDYNAALTSDGAAAFWERRSDFQGRWARETLAHYKRLLAAGLGEEAGVAEMEGQSFSYVEAAQEYSGMAEEDTSFRWGTPAELAAACQRTGLPLKCSLRYTSVGADSPRYVRWLLRSVRARAPLRQARLTSLAQLSDAFHVVVNASGFGARELVGDAAVYAYRGQVIRVHAPQVREWATVTAVPGHPELNTYVLPRLTSGVVTCGGTYERDREELATDEAQKAALWARCLALVPALGDPQTVVLHDWVGLRPGRDGDVRLELEEMAVPGQAPLMVVHAYGHGGCGHSLHYGTALDVLGLVREAHQRLGTELGARVEFAAPEPVL